MFNLIISIIAIALVVVLAGASLYYGGDAFNRGSSDAKAATLINQAQQIQAAATLFTASEGGAPTAIADLEGAYLSSTPSLPVGADGANWELGDAKNASTATVSIVSVELPFAAKTEDGITKDICKTVNKNGAGVVFCSVAADGTFTDANLVAGAGSAEADVEAIDVSSGTAKAKVHMTI
ncbi:hypothetical protein HJ167_18990 [Vibrio parahaemolyticus]|uniref:hypothetical protein n=1 Tax=Vibrio parahaemolyticus TaxID=670 RepID=UPI00387B8D5E|nr:hypothetical protein [Vibrio parahaemolyticus]MDG3410137.1 hypothetical protein [Vibrio parahaemolyticus]